MPPTIVPMPTGITFQDVKGGGTTGLAALFPGTQKIIKFPWGEPDTVARCKVEIEVYRRLQESPHDRPTSILQYYGLFEGRATLEYAENGSLRQFLRKTKRPPSEQVILRWAQQAAQALSFCHSHGVLHGDICCSNYFLDHDLNLKLGDFAGSCIDQSRPSIFYSHTHQLPDTDTSLQTEIFAFGSSLYEMVTGSPPYAGMSDAEVEGLFRSKRFPNVTFVEVLGTIISRCWRLEFDSMVDVLKSIEDEGL